MKVIRPDLPILQDLPKCEDWPFNRPSGFDGILGNSADREQMEADLTNYSVYITKDGKRIPPEEFYAKHNA